MSAEDREQPPFGAGLVGHDWKALAQAKQERWLRLTESDREAAIHRVWAMGKYVRAIASPEALERDRKADFEHHLQLARLMEKIGPLLR